LRIYLFQGLQAFLGVVGAAAVNDDNLERLSRPVEHGVQFSDQEE
jgi:hypothetical protein